MFDANGKFDLKLYDARAALERAKRNRRTRGLDPAFDGLDPASEEFAEVLRTRVAVAWCGSRELFDEIFAPVKEVMEGGCTSEAKVQGRRAAVV